MGQVLHGCARTTEPVRRAIQPSQESLRSLARGHGVNPKTIAKWGKRTSVADRKTGPAPKSTVLSLQQEAVAFHHARQPLLGCRGDQARTRSRGDLRAHAFEFACAKAGIDHRLTKPKHPCTNGQVERMNRTLKQATVKRFYYQTHQYFRQHLTDFVNACNFARRLKTLRGLYVTLPSESVSHN